MDHRGGYTETCTMIPSQPQYGVQRFSYIITQHVTSLVCGIWDLQGRPGAQGFRKLAPLRTKQLWGPFPTSLPRKARDSFENVFIQNVYETACKEAWSIATPLIAADYSGHTGFFRQESVLLLHSSLDINKAKWIRLCMLYSNFGRRPHFWLSFSNSVHPLLFLHSTIMTNPIWCCNNEGHGFFHLRKTSSRCLITLFAFSGQNQAHNLTHIFHMSTVQHVLTAK